MSRSVRAKDRSGVGAAGLAALLFASACVARNGFRCDEGEGRECRQGDVEGSCTEAGYCGFPDAECRSGMRYGDESPGELAGLCVGAENADAGGDDGDDDDDGGGADASTLVDFTPSNIPPGRLTAGEGELACDDGGVTIDTDAGTVTRDGDDADLLPSGAAVTLESQGDGPDLRVIALGSLRIDDGCTIEVTGSAALVFALGDSADIGGTIDLTGGRGSREVAGPGGFAGGTAAAPAGGGPGGGGQPGAGAVGGGGGGHSGVGGHGGDRNGPLGGLGGGATGDDSLVPLVGGSGGSAGGVSGGGTPGNGGGGGGALQIAARGVIAISGAINVGGGGGASSSANEGGGGGGAGGAILLEAGGIEITGALAANGGGGGAGASSTVAGGADGQPGAATINRAAGGPAAGLGTAGGSGGAGATPDGAVGVSTDQADPNNCGGGGGGAGRIRLRSSTLSAPGVVSPPATPSNL